MSVLNRIREYFSQPRGRIVFGIDGYIDEVWQIIETRKNTECFTLREKMKSFGTLITECQEGGVSNEIIRKRRTYGGFCANTGKAAASIGANVILVGMFGKNAIEPVFEPLQSVCELISVGDPAISHIFEFTDGKIMLPYIQEVTGFNWNTLKAALMENQLGEIYKNADIIALGYWSLMPAFDEILTGICDNFCRRDGSQRLFFDFADIRKRDQASLKGSLRLMSNLSCKYDLPMTLSLNEHEARLLFAYSKEIFDESQPESIAKALPPLRDKLGLDELIVHTPHFAAGAAGLNEALVVKQQYCETPVITTGAGDNFNGGYVAASLGDLTFYERMLVSNAAAGFYVRNGHSATAQDIFAELSMNNDL